MATKRFLVEERKLNLMVKYNLHQPWDNHKYRVAVDAAVKEVGVENEERVATAAAVNLVAVDAKHAVAGKHAAAQNVKKGTTAADGGQRVVDALLVYFINQNYQIDQSYL
jgi:hypothetical protein